MRRISYAGNERGRWSRMVSALTAMVFLASVFGCDRHAKRVVPPAAQPAGYRPGVFEDVTERAGISFRHTNGDTSQFLFPETFGGGCAFFDYDQDGYPDILLLNSGKLSGGSAPNLALYHNEKNGTFKDVTAECGLDKPLGYGQSVTVGDYDNDGYPDIFEAGYGGCHLFHNVAGKTGGRTFEDVTAAAGVGDNEAGPRWASGAVWLDYDRDGKLDLFIIHYAVWSPAIDKKCPRPDGSPGYCVPNVYDGDGVRLYHNEGGGRFKDVTQQAGLSAVRGRGLAVGALDYNGDGRDDIYIANDLDRNYLLRNNGNGTFTEVALEAGVSLGGEGLVASGMGIALGDYDHSGRESIFVTNLNGERFSFFQARPGGRFDYGTDRVGLAPLTLNHSGWGVAFIDFDRDGWADIVSANGNVHPVVSSDLLNAGYEEPRGLYRNTGAGRFEDASAASGALARPKAGRGMATGDFDNDGRIDLLCLNRNDRADLFRNDSGDRNHWVSILLVGTRSNRDAAGARIRLSAGGVQQYAECRLGSSYASTSDKRLHFGLGGAATIDQIEIDWPSGLHEKVQGLPAGRFYLATEGKGVTEDARIPRPK